MFPLTWQNSLFTTYIWCTSPKCLLSFFFCVLFLFLYLWYSSQVCMLERDIYEDCGTFYAHYWAHFSSCVVYCVWHSSRRFILALNCSIISLPLLSYCVYLKHETVLTLWSPPNLDNVTSALFVVCLFFLFSVFSILFLSSVFLFSHVLVVPGMALRSFSGATIPDNTLLTKFLTTPFVRTLAPTPPMSALLNAESISYTVSYQVLASRALSVVRMSDLYPPWLGLNSTGQ